MHIVQFLNRFAPASFTQGSLKPPFREYIRKENPA